MPQSGLLNRLLIEQSISDVAVRVLDQTGGVWGLGLRMHVPRFFQRCVMLLCPNNSRSVGRVRNFLITRIGSDIGHSSFDKPFLTDSFVQSCSNPSNKEFQDCL
jgi:hypothetical protein